jgi:hypothetical protein
MENAKKIEEHYYGTDEDKKGNDWLEILLDHIKSKQYGKTQEVKKVV